MYLSLSKKKKCHDQCVLDARLARSFYAVEKNEEMNNDDDDQKERKGGLCYISPKCCLKDLFRINFRCLRSFIVSHVVDSHHRFDCARLSFSHHVPIHERPDYLTVISVTIYKR